LSEPNEEEKKNQTATKEQSPDEKYEALDMKRLLRNEKLLNSQEFPFSNVHVEDQLFLVDPDPSKQRPIIFALECIFFMSDCHYMELNQQTYPNEGGDSAIISNVNRMGTENYKLADFEENTMSSAFRERPTNLRVDRKKTYTHKIKESLMKT
jgi:hypothetical protein